MAAPPRPPTPLRQPNPFAVTTPNTTYSPSGTIQRRIVQGVEGQSNVVNTGWTLPACAREETISSSSSLGPAIKFPTIPSWVCPDPGCKKRNIAESKRCWQCNFEYRLMLLLPAPTSVSDQGARKSKKRRRRQSQPRESKLYADSAPNLSLGHARETTPKPPTELLSFSPVPDQTPTAHLISSSAPSLRPDSTPSISSAARSAVIELGRSSGEDQTEEAEQSVRDWVAETAHLNPE